MTIEWTRVSAYCIRCDTHTIAKVAVDGDWGYEVFERYYEGTDITNYRGQKKIKRFRPVARFPYGEDADTMHRKIAFSRAVEFVKDGQIQHAADGQEGCQSP